MNTNKVKKFLIWLSFSLVWMFGLTNEALAQYNPPTYSKVEVVRNPQGQSYLELKFHWSSELPPNFDAGVAVEFEIHVDNKCFVQPIGGKDDDHRCDQRLGKEGFNLPNDLVGPPTNANNCYLDVWNYWAPDAWTIAQEVGDPDRCGSIGSRTATCLFALDAVGKVVDPEGNFAVGLHEANSLQAGITYFFKYPVEINNTKECQDKYGDRIDEGLAWVNMQTFSNVCLLTPVCADYDSLSSFFHPYTCPELIGADDGCWNANKDNQLWLNNICVPTDIVNYTPVTDAIEDLGGVWVCEGKNHPGEHTENNCCVDKDDDGYYAQQSVATWGTQTGDCNDQREDVHPFADEIVDDGIDSDCDGDGNTTSAGLFGDILVAGHTPPCPGNSECHPGDQTQVLCADGVNFQQKICNNCMWEVISDCPSGACTPNQTAGCGNCGTQTCNGNSQWGACQNQGACSPGQTQQQTCNGIGTQTSVCQGNCSWGSWGACSVNPVCSPGQTQQQSCTTANNQPGTQTRTCDANGQWGGWGACLQSCSDVYLSSASPACYTNPGGPTLCLSVQQVNGSNWQYRICKQGGTFSNNYKTVLHDDNHSPQLGDTYVGNSGDACSPWRPFSVSYVSGYGPVNGAGVRAEVLSPSNCGQPGCTYSTGTVTVRKECQ